MTVFLLAALLAAPVPADEAKDAGPAVAVKRALGEPADVNLDGKSLTELAAFVKARAKIEVVIDTATLGGAGIDVNVPLVTARVRDGKLRDVLKAALDPLGLKAGVVGGTLFVSTEDAVTTKQMRQRVTVMYAGTPLPDVLKKLAAETGANLVLDPRQEAKAAAAAVKLELDDVPLETAVRLAAEVGGFRAVRLNNVLFITTDDRADKLRPDADGPAVAPPAGFGGVIDIPRAGPAVLVPPAAAIPVKPEK